ncbi:DNA-directed RNA polymerase II 19 kda polypeptide [Nadsonia fulvescens var. elongata DSM 6958]|uniref:DNA-directed RNA polymerase subunit n=1 Tax=Nadsonia fulvescens var. elongata DSM 6958 TaxID=857566 RepID=A0A1E3PML3_9ASCO|nr:DNA-directed RNA polymerase II 19 kda polypeptide [Nadsonia fulvescens var. elongata DSM 6958]
MFFIKDLSLSLTLHPSYFGPQMVDYLKSKLLADVEGTCTGQFGYIVCVLDGMNIDVGKGRVIPSNGSAEFEVKYRAVVWRPFKGEVVDAIVTNVNKMGYFADVGPLSVFVSSHLIPSDMSFNPTANPPAFVSDDQTIEKGSRVRLKIVGVRADVGEMFAIGSIKEDYLGVL